MSENPLVSDKRVGKYEAIAFNLFKLEHFKPAILAALNEAEANFELVRNNPERPTFENTILALDNGSEHLSVVYGVYNNLYSVHSDNEFKALGQELSPLMSEFNSKINTDDKLLASIKAIYNARKEYSEDAETVTLIEETYDNFVRGGAMLVGEDKEKMKEINKELSILNLKF